MNEAFGGIIRKIDTPYVLNLMADKCNSESQEAIKNEFKVDDEDTFVYSDRKHQILTGDALKLAKKAILNGGTEDEVIRALKYLWVCINMKKYALDCKKAFDGLGMGKISIKYDREDQCNPNNIGNE